MESTELRSHEFIREIGSGVFGTVILSKNRKTGKLAAVKKIFGAFSSKIDAQRTYREIMYLRLFKPHPNIINLHGIEKKDMNVYLIFELMSTDLQNVIKRKSLNDSQQRCIMYQLFRALNYMHSINVAHRDLKPSNILLNEDCVLKVADFGLAKVASALKIPNGFVIQNKPDDLIPMTEYIATRWYRAPELLAAVSSYTTGIDVWSAGCIMGEVLLNRPLFPGTNPVNQVECIMSALPSPSMSDIDSLCAGFAAATIQRAANRPKRLLRQLLGSLSADSFSLMEKMLMFDPRKRCKVAECMQHSYVQRYFKEEHLSERSKNLSLDDSDDITIEDYKDKIVKIINEDCVKQDDANISLKEENVKKIPENISRDHEQRQDSAKGQNNPSSKQSGSVNNGNYNNGSQTGALNSSTNQGNSYASKNVGMWW